MLPITEQSVITALADENLSADQRKSLALALYKTPWADKFQPEQPKFPDVFDEKLYPNKLWFSGQVPQLQDFVGPRSWLIFNKLQLGQVDCEWLQLEPTAWSLMSGYQRFRKFVTETTIVNDPAEHGVALAADFRSSFQQESVCQSNLVTVAESRKLVPRGSKQSVKAVSIKKICGI